MENVTNYSKRNDNHIHLNSLLTNSGTKEYNDNKKILCHLSMILKQKSFITMLFKYLLTQLPLHKQLLPGNSFLTNQFVLCAISASSALLWKKQGLNQRC